MDSEFTTLCLGSASAVPPKKRFHTAHVLNVCGRSLLLDCGEATQFALRDNNINPVKIDSIFITHLHADHVLGLFGFIVYLSLIKRTNPLHVYAPQGIERYIDFILSTLKVNEMTFEVVPHPISGIGEQTIFADSSLRVTAFPLIHSVSDYGYKFEEIATGKSYAYCTDTAYNPNMVQYIKGVNLLFHEATFLERDKSKAEKYLHSTAADAAKIAKEAGVGKLLLGHFTVKCPNLNEFLEEALPIFPETYLALEGKVFKIK